MSNSMAFRQWRSRQIIERIVVEGRLALDTPTSLSNGDTDAITDIPLLTDPLEGRALLTGASLAGALRNYLRVHTLGYGQYESTGESGLPIVTRLFGSLEGDGEQSPLIVDDALGREPKPQVELRDGVRIDGRTRTAYIDEKGKGAKFNLELLEAGTEFDLRFELIICDGDAPPRDELVAALVTALRGLESGEIHLGGRKRRGYGQVSVTQWRVKSFDLCKPADLRGWIEYGGEKLLDYDNEKLTARGVARAVRIADSLGVAALNDARSVFYLKAEFSLDGSLLIRSGGRGEPGPDMVHLRSKHRDSERDSQTGELLSVAVLSGTSLTGALRARATKIVNTLAPQSQTETVRLIANMFGTMAKKQQSQASRVIVRERVIRQARTDLVQSRVSIDRFTGGAREAAFFNQQPAFGQPDTTVTVELSLVAPQPHEIGLLLLLLKDLWTGDLPLGGESSVGRGRLRGKEAVMVCRHPGFEVTWTLRAKDEQSDELDFIGDNFAALENYVGDLNQYLREVAQ